MAAMFKLASLPLVLMLALGPATLAADEHSADYVTGAPRQPTKAWTLSAGGRLYDSWMEALGVPGPKTTHPAWPASNTKRRGNVTWRCKSCHGWDYLGASGNYGAGPYFTGIPGVRGVIGKDLDEIIKIISDDTHGYTDAMIPPTAKRRLALFLSEGQGTVADVIRPSGSIKGNADRGGPIFQNTCAACHGYDGRALGLGRDHDEFVGTIARTNPWEVLHKIRNGQPGQNMISLRAFPIEVAAPTRARCPTSDAEAASARGFPRFVQFVTKPETMLQRDGCYYAPRPARRHLHLWRGAGAVQ